MKLPQILQQIGLALGSFNLAEAVQKWKATSWKEKCGVLLVERYHGFSFFFCPDDEMQS
jgi:hypothetical protein